MEGSKAKKWCENGIAALLSLWDAGTSTAWRSSVELSEFLEAPKKTKQLFPTATAHAVIAFASCGLCEKGVDFDPKRLLLKTADFEIFSTKGPPKSATTLRALLCGALRASSKANKGKHKHWLVRLLGRSSQAARGHLAPRVAITLNSLIHAVRVLVQTQKTVLNTREKRKVLKCADEVVEHLLKVLGFKINFIPTEIDFLKNQLLSPHLLMHVAIALDERRIIRAVFGRDKKGNASLELKISSLERALSGYFRRQIDFHMARHRVDLDHEYDPMSLGFSLRAMALLQPRFKKQPLYRASIEAVLAAQRPDGCWPDGISVTYSANGDSVQQPSVEIALQVSETVFSPDLLLRIDSDDLEMLASVLTALKKFADYLVASYRELDKHNHQVLGWASDRVRAPGLVETWITAMAVRVFRNIWLVNQACERAAILLKYPVTWPDHRTESAKATTISGVVDPDVIVKPATTLFNIMVQPILEQQVRGALFCTPVEAGVSAILFGPPGSGKTYFVSRLAATLGWPLLSMSPGHFIQRGTEFIESTTASIFLDLMKLRHAVVFFDECDELFRNRDEVQGGHRNIFSFVTACMLAKLQQLHDAQNIIFILGTNYVSRIDSAIRRQGRFDAVLLFDRPDSGAREEIIKRELEKLNCKPLGSKPLTMIVSQSEGLVVKEIKELARAIVKRKKCTPSDLSDYVDWCIKWGPAEIKAAGETQERQKAIMKRWKCIDGVGHRNEPNRK